MSGGIHLRRQLVAKPLSQHHVPVYTGQEQLHRQNGVSTMLPPILHNDIHTQCLHVRINNNAHAKGIELLSINDVILFSFQGGFCEMIMVVDSSRVYHTAN